MLAAVVLLQVSWFSPYWEMKLRAPQFPHGLEIKTYLDRIEGDIEEINELNHYIGMQRLDDAAQFERSVAIFALPAVGALAIFGMLLSARAAPLLALPLVLTPVLFLADLYYWLYRWGHDLDPYAPLNRSVGPFMPMIVGAGKVAQFTMRSSLEEGFWLAASAAVVGLGALTLRWWLGRAATRQ